jgi:hypothetical protein
VPAPAAPLVTLTLNRFPPQATRAGLRRMATDHVHLRGLPGLDFYRLLGTGRGAHLTPGMDLRRWARLAVWPSPAAFELFEAGRWRQRERGEVAASATLVLRPLRAHGQWAGRQPFGTVPAGPAPAGPLAVLTRAAIRPSRLTAFWRAVPAAQAALAGGAGLRSVVALGEWPLLYQATFSVWSGVDAMHTYAYGPGGHRPVIARTRAEGWYREELFARFAVLETRGDWTALAGGAA